MNVRIVAADALAAPDLARWSELQRAKALYRSPFFRPEFALAVARVRDVRVAVVEDAGSVAGFFAFEAGRLGHGRPAGRPFSDYHGPVLDDDAAIDARALVRASGLATWSFDHLPAGIASFAPHVWDQGASPLLDLAEGFDLQAAGGRAPSDVRGAQRKARKLAREIGPLRFVAQSDDPALLAQTIAWKRQQYAATGVTDVLADAGGRELLGHVHAARAIEFAGVLSVLYAGDEVAALHLGLRADGVLHSWFPAYNSDLHRYSPGLVLLLELAAAAPELGIRELDFGKGEARYKQALATGTVPLHEGCVGARPLSALPIRLGASARRAVRAAGVHRAARRALRR
ncbi:MAG TPA: GNAT family N-acetyltransferase [Solirubrobacteraceae bacterium]|nr:GNAT family N-acetyltransferase [Solirubrobacteraceae bacterium]